jgi:hypothetical protein
LIKRGIPAVWGANAIVRDDVASEAQLRTARASDEKSQTPMFKRQKTPGIKTQEASTSLVMCLRESLWRLEFWNLGFRKFRNLTCSPHLSGFNESIAHVPAAA